eukprot:122365_1
MSIFLSLIKKIFKWFSRAIKWAKRSKKHQYIALILFCEFIFYLRHKYLEYYVNYSIPINIIEPTSKHRLQTIVKYEKIYRNYFVGSFADCLSATFNNCSLKEIKKQNIENWLKYMHFSTFDLTKLNTQEVKWRENIVQNLIKTYEDKLGHKFEEGHNKKVQSTLCIHQQQKMKIVFHPLTLYLNFWMGKQTSSAIFLFYFKFNYKYIKGIKVWYKLNEINNSKLEPLLIIGGVSAGNPLQCILFINSLLTKYKNSKNIFVLEIPWTEMSIIHFIPYCGYLKNNLPLSMDEMADIVFELEGMILDHNGMLSSKPYQRQLKLQWNLCGESYGSAICSAIYQKIRFNSLGIIPRLILIDAGILCITDPSGVKYAAPQKTIGKRLFQYFVFHEIMIATLTERYTFWYNFALFPHELINDGCNKQHIVVSGTEDYLIPLMSIKKGIEEANKLCDNDGKQIVHIVMNQVTHAEFWIHTKYHKDVMDLLQ